jgi:hypothetical protein
MPSACTRENAVRIRASAPTSVAVAEGFRHWIVAPVMRVQVPPVTRGVGVLGVLTAFAMRKPDRFDAGTLHQFLKWDLSSYGRASALQAGEIGSTPLGSTKLVSGLVADAVSAAV